MKNNQDNTGALSALLRTANGVDTLETKSLCCEAAGIIAPSSATAEALIPHEKLRGAALADATLNAQECPLAQPVVGYTHGWCYWPSTQHQDDDQVLIEEHRKFIAGELEDLIDRAADFQDQAYALGLARGCPEAPAPVTLSVEDRIDWMGKFNGDLWEDWVGDDSITSERLPSWMTENGVPERLPSSQLSALLTSKVNRLEQKLAAQHQADPVVSLELVFNEITEGLHIRKWENLGGLTAGVHTLYSAPVQLQDLPKVVIAEVHSTCKPNT